MIAEILPAIRMPRSTGSYSYSVPLDMQKNIDSGQIVNINLRNKQVLGVVIKIKNKTEQKFKVKPVEQIISLQKLITAQQIKLIDFLYEQNACARSISLKSILPDVPQRFIKKDLKPFKVKIIKGKKISQKFIWQYDQQKVFDVLNKKVKTTLKNKKQILILVPDKNSITKLSNELKINDKNLIVNHSTITKTQHFDNWLDILAGKSRVVIGTKISVFLPWTNLSEIVIFNEHNWDHKQSDINPRFDARLVAEWLSNENKCVLTRFSPAPSMESYSHNKTTLKSQISKQDKKIKIVNLKYEKSKGNYSFLSDEFVEQTQEHLNQGKNVFVFHNRKGLANHVFCASCGHVFSCPECEISLVYNLNDKKMSCRYCDFSQEVPPFCPACQKADLQFKGQGVEKVAREINKIFPESKVLALEKTSDKQTGIKNIQADIVVGTEFVMDKIDFNKFGLIVFLNFDQLLNRSDFRTSEQAYQIFYDIYSNTQADFILQTYEPDNFIVRSILNNQPEIFYQQELDNRKQFNYPPFSKIIKIIYKDLDEKNVVNKLKKVISKIKSFDEKIEILGPTASHPKKVRNKFIYSLILKIDKIDSQIFKLVPNDMIIDVEPERLG